MAAGDSTPDGAPSILLAILRPYRGRPLACRGGTARGNGRTRYGQGTRLPGRATARVTYAANVWHHPLTILDRPACFAMYMWLEGSNGDEEFFTLPAAVTIARP